MKASTRSGISSNLSLKGTIWIVNTYSIIQILAKYTFANFSSNPCLSSDYAHIYWADPFPADSADGFFLDHPEESRLQLKRVFPRSHPRRSPRRPIRIFLFPPWREPVRHLFMPEKFAHDRSRGMAPVNRHIRPLPACACVVDPPGRRYPCPSRSFPGGGRSNCCGKLPCLVESSEEFEILP